MVSWVIVRANGIGLPYRLSPALIPVFRNIVSYITMLQGYNLMFQSVVKAVISIDEPAFV